MVDEEEYLRPFVGLDELLATKIFFNKKKLEFCSTPRMVFEGDDLAAGFNME